jgi:hypothetical protein
MHKFGFFEGPTLGNLLEEVGRPPGFFMFLLFLEGLRILKFRFEILFVTHDITMPFVFLASDCQESQDHDT